jgi:hypothetical protein
MSKWVRAKHGFVLWIVPNESIYTQTHKALNNREHPYRQILDRTAAGRVKILEKTTPLDKRGKPMLPDLLVVRQSQEGYLFDILEPHNPSFDDNVAKAVGLAKFAEHHWALYDRIQLIRKKKGTDGAERYFRLDVGNDAVRKKVLAVTTNSQLDQVFDDEAVVR